MEDVRIAVLSQDNTVLFHMDNTRPRAMHYYDETLTTYLEGSASRFSFTVDSNHIDAPYIYLGGHVSFRYKDIDYFLTISEIEEDEKEMKIECVGNSLELTNRYVSQFTGTSLSFEQYLRAFDTSNVLEIGVNQISARRRSIEFADSDTLMYRLFTLANAFGSEIAFKSVLDTHYRLNSNVVDIYRADSTNQGMGIKRYDRYRYGREIEGITRTANINELFTAIKPKGNNNLSIKSVSNKVLDDNGNVLFFTLENSSYIYAPQSRNMFPSSYGDSDKYIEYEWSYDTDNVNVLYAQALALLKRHSMPELEYNVTGFIDANIGDSIIVVDEAFASPLYIRARIIQQEIHFTDPERNKTTLDNYTTLLDLLPTRDEEIIYIDDDFS